MKKPKYTFAQILTRDYEELTDLEKVSIEVGFYCNRCKNMEINIDCSYCLPLKADNINEYLRSIREMHDFAVIERQGLTQMIGMLQDELDILRDK